MIQILLVGVGGFIGAVLRYSISIWISGKNSDPTSFPLGTLSVNVIGCFIIGLLAGSLLISGVISERAKLFLIVGLLGGFTTFSAFGYESLNLLRSGQSGTAAAYVLLTLAMTLFTTWLGYIIGKAITG